MLVCLDGINDAQNAVCAGSTLVCGSLPTICALCSKSSTMIRVVRLTRKSSPASGTMPRRFGTATKVKNPTGSRGAKFFLKFSLLLQCKVRIVLCFCQGSISLTVCLVRGVKIDVYAKSMPFHDLRVLYDWNQIALYGMKQPHYTHQIAPKIGSLHNDPSFKERRRSSMMRLMSQMNMQVNH